MAHRRRCQAWRQNQQPRGLPPRLHTLYVVRILARKMTREVRHAACASKLVIAYDGDSETRLLPEAVKIVIVCVYVCMYVRVPQEYCPTSEGHSGDILEPASGAMRVDNSFMSKLTT